MNKLVWFMFIKSKYRFAFISLCILALIIYPLWLLPSTLTRRFMLFTFFIILIFFSSYIFKKIFNIEEHKENKDKLYKDKHFMILLLFCALFFLLQIPAMNFPIMFLSDESYHITRGSWLIEPFESLGDNMLNISFLNIARFLFLFIIIIFSVIYLKWNKLKYYFEKINPILKNKKVRYFTLFILVLLAYAYFFITNYFAALYHLKKYGTANLDHLNWLVWYGPISSLLYALQIIIFGYKEFGMRFIQPIFFILSSVYIFKIVELFKEKKIALLSAIFFLFFPGIFYYGHEGILEPGFIFFIIISFFYFLKYEIKKEDKYLILTGLFIALGYLYKQPALFALPIILVYISLKHWINKTLPLKIIFGDIKNVLKIFLIGLTVIIPWFIINLLYDERYREIFTFADISYNKITIIFSLIPKQVTWPLFILFLGGLLYAYIYRKNKLNLFMLVWFFVWYGIFMNYKLVLRPGLRMGMPLLPVVAILCSVFLVLLTNKIKKENIKKIIILIPVLFLIIFSTYLTYHDYEKKYLPVDDMFRYIKSNINPEAKILVTTAPPPYPFYIKKYNIKNDLVHEVWVDYKKQDITNLYEYSIKNNISYVMFPYPKPAYLAYWPENYTWIEHDGCGISADFSCPLNKTLVEKLSNIKENTMFKLIKETNNKFNKMILLKVKK